MAIKDRRFDGILLLISIFVFGYQPTCLLADGDKPVSVNSQYVKILWRMPEGYSAGASEKLQFNGTVKHEKNSKGVPAVVILAGVVLLPYLADTILDIRRDMKYGGIVVDARGSEIKIDNDPRLDGGVVVVVSKEGTKIFESDNFVDPNVLIESIKNAK